MKPFFLGGLVVKKNVNIFIFMCVFILNGHLKAFAAEVSNSNNSDFSSEVDQALDPITPDETSLLEKKIQNQKKYGNIPNFVSLYKVNYLLPYYFTVSPDNAVYQGSTPNNQSLMQTEFKGQFSVDVPVVHNLFYAKNLSLHASYTQLVYWQFYADSQYFRETDYEPSVFLSYHLYKNWLLNSGFIHQSNGRGGQNERSWNRVFGSVQLSGENWFTEIEGWGLIFQSASSDLHNSDIEKYLGHEHITLAYKLHDLVLTLELQNIESGLQKGYFMVSANYPLTNQINLMAQYFNGYGQSLIEYDHFTQAFGAGISFNSLL
jgi:phospholipase A1